MTLTELGEALNYCNDNIERAIVMLTYLQEIQESADAINNQLAKEKKEERYET